MPYGLGASLPTATATTPSHFSARLVSMRLMRACGYGECRILPTSMPGTLRSSVYLPAPVVFPAASIMAVGLPIMEKPFISLFIDGYRRALGCNRRPDGFIHLAVAGAAAQVAAQCGTNVGF